MIIESRTFARAGLIGNPSDGYFGKTISVIIGNFGARISMFETPELVIEEQPEDGYKFSSIYEMYDTVTLTGYYGGARLIKAAIKKFCGYCLRNDIKFKNKNFTIRYQSTIPRQVGLAGSSAIVIATFKALMQFYEVDIPLNVLPTLALKAETQELGINAGLQDRVIQTFGGIVYMDFEKENLQKNGYGKYTPLKNVQLPNLYLAYKTELGKVSGTVLNDIKIRYDKGDKHVVDTLDKIASLADETKVILESGKYDALNEIINQNFDYRKQIMNISDSNLELVETARKCGASAKFSGSGGAIIGMYKDDEMLSNLIVNLKKINARVIKPYII